MHLFTIIFQLTALALSLIAVLLGFLRSRYRNHPALCRSLLNLTVSLTVTASFFFHGEDCCDLALCMAFLALMTVSPTSNLEKIQWVVCIQLYIVVLILCFLPGMHIFAFLFLQLSASAEFLWMRVSRIVRPYLIAHKPSFPSLVTAALNDLGWMVALLAPSVALILRLMGLSALGRFLVGTFVLLPLVILLNSLFLMPGFAHRMVERLARVGRRTSPPERVEASKPSVDDFLYSLYNSIDKWVRDDRAFLTQVLTVDVVAKKFYTNRNYVSRAVGLYSGHSFSEYVNSVRVEYAKSLARANPCLTVTDLAHLSGYALPTTFSMAFRRLHNNKTPRDWLADLRSQKKK